MRHWRIFWWFWRIKNNPMRPGWRRNFPNVPVLADRCALINLLSSVIHVSFSHNCCIARELWYARHFGKLRNKHMHHLRLGNWRVSSRVYILAEDKMAKSDHFCGFSLTLNQIVIDITKSKWMPIKTLVQERLQEYKNFALCAILKYNWCMPAFNMRCMYRLSFQFSEDYPLDFVYLGK